LLVKPEAELAELGGGSEFATGPGDPRSHRPDRDIERYCHLLIGQFAPRNKQQRVPIVGGKTPQFADEVGAQTVVLVLNELRRRASEVLQRFEPAHLEPAVTGDDVVCHTEQPGQRTVALCAVALTSTESADEHLGGEILAWIRTDPPRHVATDGLAVTVI
jgi:hypothetical protein